MSWFRYVPLEKLDDYCRLGWLPVSDLGPVHGQWSVLCRWLCECHRTEPRA